MQLKTIGPFTKFGLPMFTVSEYNTGVQKLKSGHKSYDREYFSVQSK